MKVEHSFAAKYCFLEKLFYRKLKRVAFIWTVSKSFVKIKKIFTVTFDKCNATLLNKSIHFFKNK